MSDVSLVPLVPDVREPVVSLDPLVPLVPVVERPVVPGAPVAPVVVPELGVVVVMPVPAALLPVPAPTPPAVPEVLPVPDVPDVVPDGDVPLRLVPGEVIVLVLPPPCAEPAPALPLLLLAPVPDVPDEPLEPVPLDCAYASDTAVASAVATVKALRVPPIVLSCAFKKTRLRYPAQHRFPDARARRAHATGVPARRNPAWSDTFGRATRGRRRERRGLPIRAPFTAVLRPEGPFFHRQDIHRPMHIGDFMHGSFHAARGALQGS